MVRRMAWRINRVQGPSIALDRVPVAYFLFWFETLVDESLAGKARRAGTAGFACLSIGIDRRTGSRLESIDPVGMVTVGVGQQDMRDRCAANRIHDGFQVSIVVGTRIHDRDVSVAQDEGVGALEGEGARIVRDHAPDAGRHFMGHAIVEIHRPFECKVCRGRRFI